jgi:two-component system, chemotaxis family, protein-glutamate methylesterase/glutaminase
MFTDSPSEAADPARLAHGATSVDARAEFDIVVVATSLGGRDALERLLAPLPADFAVPILVVQHVNARAPSYLPELLARRTLLAVRHAGSGERLRASTVYVASPDRHLTVGVDRRCLLSDGPPVAYSRPSADPLFVSAAGVFGARTLGVILTGRLSDGSAGAEAIQRAAGVVLAQSPVSCRAAAMPEAAIARGVVDLVLPLASLGAALLALVTTPGARVSYGIKGHAA